MGSLGTSPPRLGIGELEICQETTFGTPATYKFIQMCGQPDISGIHRQHFPSESLRGTWEKQFTHIMGPSGMVPLESSFQTSHYLSGFLGSLPDAAGILAAYNSTTGYPIAWLLRQLLGGQAYGGIGAEDAVTVSTVSSIDLTDLDASLIDAGHCFSLPTAAAAGYEAAFVKSATMATEVIVPRVNLEGAPTGGGTIYGGITSYATASLPDSCSLRWTGWLESASTPLRFVASGAVPASAEITLNPREQPKITITWRFATFTWTSGITPGSGYNLWAYGAAGTTEVPAPETIVARRFVYYTAVDTYTDLDTPTCVLNIDNDLQAFPDPNGPGGIKTWRCGPNRSHRCTVRLPYTGETWWESQTQQGLQFTHGSQPGKMLAVSMPNVHPVEPPSGPSDENGYGYATWTFEAQRYTSDTEPAGGQAADNRPMSIGLC